MKRIVFYTLLMVVVTFTTKAQETSAFFGELGFTVSPKAKISPFCGIDLMWNLNGSWMVGGTVAYRNHKFVENSNSTTLPFNNLSIKLDRVGIGGLVRCNLPYRRNRQFLMLKTIVARNYLSLTADDSRYLYIDDTPDGGTIRSNSFNMYDSQEKKWGRLFMVTMELSYNLHLHDNVVLMFNIGCDLMNNIPKKIAKTTTQLTSGWDMFEEYYGEINVCPYEEISIVKANTRPLVYFGFSVKLGDYFQKTKKLQYDEMGME